MDGEMGINLRSDSRVVIRHPFSIFNNSRKASRTTRRVTHYLEPFSPSPMSCEARA